MLMIKQSQRIVQTKKHIHIMYDRTPRIHIRPCFDIIDFSRSFNCCSNLIVIIPEIETFDLHRKLKGRITHCFFNSEFIFPISEVVMRLE